MADDEIVSNEYPKWVAPHESLIHRQKAREGQVRPGSENSIRVSDDAPDHISVPGFTSHVDRAGNVTVLVADESEERRATEPAAETESE